MDANPSARPSVFRAAQQWWRDKAARDGYLPATRRLVFAFADFLRDSTPERRRRRFGDADYDWTHAVDTTSGAVNWRDRLLGVFHSPYQPTDPALFREMMEALQQKTNADFAEFTFVDLGSGKGRVLLMASMYPFRRIVGVELLPALHKVAVENLNKYRGEAQKCFVIESLCIDATEFKFPDEPIVLFLFNPLPESGLKRVVATMEQTLREHPRPVYVLYHNPLLECVLRNSHAFEKIGGTHQYAIFASKKARS